MVAIRECKNCWNDHQTGQERNQRIKDFNVSNRLFQVVLFAHVRAVGNHDAHCKGHGIEKLSHRCNDGFDGKIREVRLDVIDKTIHCTIQSQCINCHCQRQQNQNRHENFADLFHTLLHPDQNDQCRAEEENRKEYNGLCCARDEGGKIVICCGCVCLSGKIDRHILDNPSPDHTVIGENQNRNC